MPKQRVHIDPKSSYSLEAMMRVMQPVGPDDLDGLHAQYQSLHTSVNRSAALIKRGDDVITPLVHIRCRACPSGTILGAVAAEDARRRGGGVVYVLETQRRVGTVMQMVPVVLAAPGGNGVGRAPIPLADTAHVDCRAHGTQTVRPHVALAAARKVYAKVLSGEKPRPRRVYV